MTRKRYKLTIIGDNGTGERFQEVQTFIHNYSMRNVTMIGQLPPEELVEHLRNHDIGIVPMIASSVFPNKLFDLLGAYLPILSLGENDTSLFVEQHNIGWTASFEGNNVGELLDDITPMDIVERVRNIEKIRNNYSKDILFRKVLAVIENKEIH